MPAVNVSFDDDELDAVRRAAKGAQQSLKSFVHDAALARADQHKHRVAAAAQLIAQRSAELNRRLRDE